MKVTDLCTHVGLGNWSVELSSKQDAKLYHLLNENFYSFKNARTGLCIHYHYRSFQVDRYQPYGTEAPVSIPGFLA